MKTLNVGLVGCGNIGTEFVQIFDDRRARLADKTGIELALPRIAVADLGKTRPAHIASRRLTDNATAIVEDPDIDIVVELIGGVTAAHDLVLRALRAGKSVVTGNKELVASAGAELYAQAAASGVDFLFEAATVAAVPIIRPLRESLLDEPITQLAGILNGTTNYILTRMSRDNIDYARALELAQSYGYAEPNPAADVEGADSAAKLAILASLAFNRGVTLDDVEYEGISGIERIDIEIAHHLNYEIKLISFAETVHDGHESEPLIRIKVFPALVPLNHPLAAVSDTYNAVYIKAQDAGELMFYGQGAGRRPTASALMGDLVDAALNRSRGVSRMVPIKGQATVDDNRGISSPFYLRMEVDDHRGVLSKVSGILANRGISIRVLEQHDTLHGAAQLVFLTHTTTDKEFSAAVDELKCIPEVIRIGRSMRIFFEH
ncbi:homoserine dehydrogenase [Nocardia arizonensis]|uniref:homoserine dehydrogenase n=1 Tax=Nocardia arizonensis TaxID=1141647 RepID=UPI000A5D80CC|nr:homoserine dehydrogenase [Nocardia arizonensis]